MAQRESSDLVFARRGFQIGESFVSHRFKEYVRMAGLDERLHWHSLRHTFASWLVQDGVSLYAVQKLLGHSSVTVTEIYSHLQPEKLHDTVNRIQVSLN
jgi:site-specific recombinase XerD